VTLPENGYSKRDLRGRFFGEAPNSVHCRCKITVLQFNLLRVEVLSVRVLGLFPCRRTRIQLSASKLIFPSHIGPLADLREVPCVSRGGITPLLAMNLDQLSNQRKTPHPRHVERVLARAAPRRPSCRCRHLCRSAAVYVLLSCPFQFRKLHSTLVSRQNAILLYLALANLHRIRSEY
jgi:hypothetical protein